MDVYLINVTSAFTVYTWQVKEYPSSFKLPYDVISMDDFQLLHLSSYIQQSDTNLTLIHRKRSLLLFS